MAAGYRRGIEVLRVSPRTNTAKSTQRQGGNVRAVQALVWVHEMVNHDRTCHLLVKPHPLRMAVHPQPPHKRTAFNYPTSNYEGWLNVAEHHPIPYCLVLSIK
jgi:hypothetical protein